MVEIKIDILEKVDEKILLINIIGSLEAIKNRAITIEEVEKFIFSPRVIRKLREIGCNNKIVDIVEKGCELEDIYSLLPEKLEEEIDKLKQEVIEIAQKYEEYSENNWLQL